MADQYTSLVDKHAPSTSSWVPSSKKVIGILGVLQLGLIAFFVTCTTYTTSKEELYSAAEYVIFRDIMVMLLLGFGFLMTFLRKYGLGAVGFTMMLTAFSIQLNIAVELFVRIMYGAEEGTTLRMPISLSTIIDGEFSAATLLISFGAVIGRASPIQLVIMMISQSFFYAFNKVFIVFGYVGAEDVGGTMTIHMFGAYFGLAVSYALGDLNSLTTENAEPNQVSDIMAMIGTTLLWVFWPSFVGATETGTPANEKICVLNTILALLGSTGATFFLTQKLCKGKFDPVHIANSTLAGGVAVGSSARLNLGPGGALSLGAAAGIISVLGYVYSSPMLENKLGLFDTCGVGNLHGYPSLLGGLMSILFVAMDSEAEFLEHSAFSQMTRQAVGVGCTLFLSIVSGYFTGVIMRKSTRDIVDEYDDGVWWEGHYFE